MSFDAFPIFGTVYLENGLLWRKAEIDLGLQYTINTYMVLL